MQPRFLFYLLTIKILDYDKNIHFQAMYVRNSHILPPITVQKTQRTHFADNLPNIMMQYQKIFLRLDKMWDLNCIYNLDRPHCQLSNQTSLIGQKTHIVLILLIITYFCIYLHYIFVNRSSNIDQKLSKTKSGKPVDNTH